MIKFKQYLVERASNPPGNYVSIGVESPIEIHILAKIFGGSHVCAGNDQHVTLMYSKNSDVSKERIMDTLHHWSSPVVATIKSVDAFDSTDKDENTCAIVFKIESPVLSEIHDRLKSDRKLVHSYPDFTPHITILYNIPLDLKEKAIKICEKWLENNTKKITLTKYVVSPIIKNWAG